MNNASAVVTAPVTPACTPYPGTESRKTREAACAQHWQAVRGKGRLGMLMAVMRIPGGAAMGICPLDATVLWLKADREPQYRADKKGKHHIAQGSLASRRLWSPAAFLCSLLMFGFAAHVPPASVFRWRDYPVNGSPARQTPCKACQSRITLPDSLSNLARRCRFTYRVRTPGEARPAGKLIDRPAEAHQ